MELHGNAFEKGNGAMAPPLPVPTQSQCWTFARSSSTPPNPSRSEALHSTQSPLSTSTGSTSWSSCRRTSQPRWKPTHPPLHRPRPAPTSHHRRATARPSPKPQPAPQGGPLASSSRGRRPGLLLQPRRARPPPRRPTPRTAGASAARAGAAPARPPNPPRLRARCAPARRRKKPRRHPPWIQTGLRRRPPQAAAR